LRFDELSADCAPGEVQAMRVAAGADKGLGMPAPLWRTSRNSGTVLLLCLAALFLLEGPTGRIVVCCVAAALLGLWVWLVAWWSRQARRIALGRARLARFAAANGFTFDPRRLPFPPDLDPELLYRGVGSDATIRDRLTGIRGRAFDTYALNFTTTAGLRPTGRNRVTHVRGVLHFELPAELPGLWLDSETRPVLGGYWNALDRYPKTLELEGDFQSQFRLRHAADANPAELLYVLQPDLMAVLHDFGRGIQLQIAGRAVYLIGRFALPSGGRRITENLFALFDALAPKLEKLALQRRTTSDEAPR
jgi:hypothetical protein